MSVGFLRKNGKRWSTMEMRRVQRRFRHHVRTPSNPRARIRREGCWWHPEIEAEGHHVDYSKPFVVVWAGLSCGCHRRIEHGTLKVPAKALFDYTSLIVARGIARPGAWKKGATKSTACTCPKRTPEQVCRGWHDNRCPKWGKKSDIPF